MRNPVLEFQHIIATNYVGIASYVFLIYDHILTFPDEVNYVWKGRKGPIIYLFFLNRYFFPFAFIVNLYAYMSPIFSYEMCKHFVRYEGATVIIGNGLTGLMMIFRVNAIYGGRRLIQAILGTIWLAQIGIYSWLLCTSTPVPHSAGIHSCSLIYDPSKRQLASLSAAGPLAFDTVVLLLTLNKGLRELRRSTSEAGILGLGISFRSTNSLMKTLLTDGVLYYCVALSANLGSLIMIETASPGIKNILVQFAQLMTVTMISRITLHLRKIGATRSTIIVSQSSRPTSKDWSDNAATFCGSGQGTSSMTSATPRCSIAEPSKPSMGAHYERSGGINVISAERSTSSNVANPPNAELTQHVEKEVA